jgi:hypothetical protein
MSSRRAVLTRPTVTVVSEVEKVPLHVEGKRRGAFPRSQCHPRRCVQPERLNLRDLEAEAKADRGESSSKAAAESSKGKDKVAEPDWEDIPFNPVPITLLSSRPLVLLRSLASQISSSAAHGPEKGPTGTGTVGCAAGGAAPKPDTPVRGPVLPPLEPERTSPGGQAPGPAAHIHGSGVPSAGQVFVKPELGRRFSRAGGLSRSWMPAMPGSMLV